jgi:riboflavin kinase/FMN adenylyltransferase
VAPDQTPLMIYRLERRIATLERQGLEALWVIRFDAAFSRISAEGFVELLRRHFAPLACVCVGRAFAFGHRRGGTVEVLEELGRRHGFDVHGLPPVLRDGRPVSSTRIREAIQAGELDEAGAMLGRPYSLNGIVQRGDRLGRRLGFPTANLAATALALPPTGVYAAWARVDGVEPPHSAVVNIGFRPSVSGTIRELRTEAHLLDFAADLYDRELDLALVRRLRDEARFADIEELKRQIGRDIANARVALHP